MAVSAIDLQKRTYRDRFHIRRYQCHPEAVRRAYELICFLPDAQRGYAAPLMTDRGIPSGWVRVHVGTYLVCDVSGMGHYRVRVKGMHQNIMCASFSAALKAMGFE